MYHRVLIRRVPFHPEISKVDMHAFRSGHVAHVERMMATGDSVAAGPLDEVSDLRALFRFRTDSLARVHEIPANDPALKKGRPNVETHSWFGPAELGFPSTSTA